MIYHPHGAVEQMLLGNNKLEQSCYNSRLQPVGMRLSSGTSPTTDCAKSSDLLNLAFGYGTSSDNNGNVLSQTIVIPKQTSGTLTLQQTYGYDGVNRLQSAGETVTAGGSGGGAWSFNQGYDQFGNMWVSSTTGLAAHSATPRAGDQFSATTNRLTKAFDGSTLLNPYDDAGNLINHPYVGAMQYDAENRQKQFTSGSITATYHYDGDGRRVKRVLGGQTTVYVYDAFGMLAAEYSTATPTETGGRRYRTTDHLGSTRLMTNSAGAVVSRHDYVPFGEELQASSSAGNRNLVFGFGASPSERHKFTGKERDAESNLDYFIARYYSSPMGRFTSVDPAGAGADRSNPQSWNGYGYVGNRPLTAVDPDGKIAVPILVAVSGAAGAAVGALIETGRQLFTRATSDSVVERTQPLNTDRIQAAAIKGAIVGATVPLVGPQGAGLTATGQGLTVGTVGVGAGALERKIDNDPNTKPLDPSQAVVDFATTAIPAAGAAVFANSTLGPALGSALLDEVAASTFIVTTQEISKEAGQQLQRGNGPPSPVIDDRIFEETDDRRTQ